MKRNGQFFTVGPNKSVQDLMVVEANGTISDEYVRRFKNETGNIEPTHERASTQKSSSSSKGHSNRSKRDRDNFNKLVALSSLRRT